MYYEVHLRDLVQGNKFVSSYRFNEFKIIHENLLKLKVRNFLYR